MIRVWALLALAGCGGRQDTTAEIPPAPCSEVAVPWTPAHQQRAVLLAPDLVEREPSLPQRLRVGGDSLNRLAGVTRARVCNQPPTPARDAKIRCLSGQSRIFGVMVNAAFEETAETVDYLAQQMPRIEYGVLLCDESQYHVYLDDVVPTTAERAIADRLSVANVLWLLDDVEALLQEGEDAARTAPLAVKLDILLRVADLAWLVEQEEHATELYLEVRRGAEGQMGNVFRLHLAEATMALGKLAISRGDDALAKELLTESLRIRRSIEGVYFSDVMDLTQVARIQLIGDEISEASATLDRAWAIYQDHLEGQELVALYIATLRAQLAETAGDEDARVALLREADTGYSQVLGPYSYEAVLFDARTLGDLELTVDDVESALSRLRHMPSMPTRVIRGMGLLQAATAFLIRGYASRATAAALLSREQFLGTADPLPESVRESYRVQCGGLSEAVLNAEFDECVQQWSDWEQGLTQSHQWAPRILIAEHAVRTNSPNALALATQAVDALTDDAPPVDRVDARLHRAHLLERARDFSGARDDYQAALDEIEHRTDPSLVRIRERIVERRDRVASLTDS